MYTFIDSYIYENKIYRGIRNEFYKGRRVLNSLKNSNIKIHNFGKIKNSIFFFLFLIDFSLQSAKRKCFLDDI